MGGLSRSFRTLLSVVVCGFLLAGCGAGSVQPATPTPTSAASVSRSASASRAASASRSVSPSVKVDPGQQAAMAKVTEFTKLLTKISGDPYSDVEEIYQVTRGDSRANWRTQLTHYHGFLMYSTGEFGLRLMEAKELEKGAKWELTYCVDLRDVELFDKNGKSLTNKNNTHATKIYVVEQDLNMHQWYVINDKIEKFSC